METEANEDFNIDEILVGKDKRFSFNISYTDGFEQKNEGEFTSHIPSLNDIIQTGIMESSYYGGANRAGIPTEIQNIAFMKATLKVCLVNWPTWFKLDDLEDLNLLESIYVQHALVVDGFRKKSKIEFNKQAA